MASYQGETVLGSSPHMRSLARKHIAPVRISKDILSGVPVHQLSSPHRMKHTAHFMLKLTQGSSRVGIGDAAEPILMIVAFLAHQSTLLQKRMGSRKIGNVNRNVMAVIGGNWR